MAWWSGKGRKDEQAGASSPRISPRLVPFVDEAQRRFSDDADEILLRHLGRPDGDEIPGGDRDGWIRDRIEESFATPDGHPRHVRLQMAVTEHLQDPRRMNRLFSGNIFTGNATDRAIAVSAYAQMLEDGTALRDRIEVEAFALARRSIDDVAARFERTPFPHVAPYPDDTLERQLWIGEILQAEHLALSTRHPDPDAIEIALASAYVRRTLEPNPNWTIPDPEPDERLTQAEIEARTVALSRLPDPALRHRFKDIPGAAESAVPGLHDHDARLAWIGSMLAIEDVRRLAGLEPAKAGQVRQVPGSYAGLRIDLLDIEFGQVTTQGALPFSGLLAVDDAALARIASDGDGRIRAVEWYTRDGPSEMAALAVYVQSAGTPRTDPDGTIRPDTLEDVVLDRVTMHLATIAYRGASATALIFCDVSAPRMELARIVVPEGGTMDEAAATLRYNMPDVVILNEMPEPEAVQVWMTLA